MSELKLKLEMSQRDVVRFHQDIAAEFGASLINKEDAFEMELVGRALDILGAMDKKDFLENYCITIGDKIYLSYVIGEGNEISRAFQVETICHEITHVTQFKKDVAMIADYLRKKSERTKFESEAFGVSAEIRRWAFGFVLEPSEVGKKLGAYMVDEDNKRIAEKRIEMINKSIGSGAMFSDVAKFTYDWWSEKVGYSPFSG